jgi:hypothetical protein
LIDCLFVVFDGFYQALGHDAGEDYYEIPALRKNYKKLSQE